MKGDTDNREFLLYTETVIAGCGNPLFGDDGFGPAVAEALQRFYFPENIRIIDAGTSGPAMIFDILDPAATKHLIVIDCADFGAQPGTIRVFNLSYPVPAGIRDAQPGGIIAALSDLAPHIKITIIGCQPRENTWPELKIDLSDEVARAIPMATRTVLELLDMDTSCPLCCILQKTAIGLTGDN